MSPVASSPIRAFEASTSSTVIPKHRRSRTGCLSCRVLKHKCDEAKPACTRCQRGSRACTYPSQSSSSSSRKPYDRNTQTPSLASPSNDHTKQDSPSDMPLISTDTMLELFSVAAAGSSFPTFDPAWNLEPIDILRTILPAPEERDLMRHFICFGTVNLCAIPQTDKPVQFFDISYCMEHPRGSSLESDALLLSLLSIGAVHRSAIHHRCANGYLSTMPRGNWGTPTAPLGSPTTASASRMRMVGDHLVASAIKSSSTALVLKDPSEPPPLSVVNTLLTSMVCSIVASGMSAAVQWKEAFDTALDLVARWGGPARLLQQASSVDAATLKRTRTMLENLAIVDVWRCMSTGSAPRLLTEPFQPWWYDFADEASPGAQLEPFHYTFGADRGMLELMNRVNILVHEHQALSVLNDQTLHLRHRQKAHDLVLELDVWEAGTSASLTVPRVHLGNSIIAQTLRVIVNVDLFDKDHADPVVQTAAMSGMTLLERARANRSETTPWANRFPEIALLVPMIIIGSMMLDEAGRNRARQVVMYMRYQTSYAYDCEEALRSLNTLYALRDAGDAKPSWRKVIGDVLLF